MQGYEDKLHMIARFNSIRADAQKMKNIIDNAAEDFPDRNEIVVLCDGSNTSSGEYVEFLKFTENHPEISYRVLNASYYTQKGLKRALSELDNNNIIY